MSVLAHVLDNATGGSTELAIISLAAMVLPFVALGFLARHFLRAGRDEEDSGARP